MPISATGTSNNATATAGARSCSRRRERGFTFVEILVVVVIIGVVIAGAVLAVSVTGQDRELEEETERLIQLMNYAREQAELQTQEFGMRCTERTYEFLQFDPRRGIWVQAFDGALRPRELPEGLRLQLEVEAQKTVLTRPDDEKDEKDLETPEPQIVIFSNGDLTSFEITLRRMGMDRQATLAANQQGKIELREKEKRR